MGLRPSAMMSRERCTCPRSSGTRNHGGVTSSVRYKVVRYEGLSSSVKYEESSRQNFIHPVRSHMKGGLVLVHPVPGIKWEGLHLFASKSHEMRACPRPFATRNQASETLTIRYEVTRMEGLSSSVRYEESSRWDFVHQLRCRAKGRHILFHPV